MTGSISWGNRTAFNQTVLIKLIDAFDVLERIGVSRSNGSAWKQVLLGFYRQSVTFLWAWKLKTLVQVTTSFIETLYLLFSTSVHHICIHIWGALRLGGVESFAKSLLLHLQILACNLALFTVRQIISCDVRKQVAHRHSFLRNGWVLQILECVIEPPILFWSHENLTIVLASCHLMHRRGSFMVPTFYQRNLLWIVGKVGGSLLIEVMAQLPFVILLAVLLCFRHIICALILGWNLMCWSKQTGGVSACAWLIQMLVWLVEGLDVGEIGRLLGQLDWILRRVLLFDSLRHALTACILNGANIHAWNGQCSVGFKSSNLLALHWVLVNSPEGVFLLRLGHVVLSHGLHRKLLVLQIRWLRLRMHLRFLLVTFAPISLVDCVEL